MGDATGEAGPEDPDLSLISIQAIDGRPIAVLANFSMHYFSGEKPVSADYFGKFSEGLKERLAPNKAAGKPAFVGIMSHGCSGDIWRMDYTKQTPPEFESIKVDEYTRGLLDIATKAMESIEYESNADWRWRKVDYICAIASLTNNVCSGPRRSSRKMGSRAPKTTEEVYAREQIILDERQETDIVVQAIRIGSIAIATTPPKPTH